MPHRLEWWTKLVAFLTGLAIAVRWAWGHIVVPSWKRWKDYEQRGEQIDKIIQSLKEGKVVHWFIMDSLKMAWYKSDVNGFTVDCSQKALAILETDFDSVEGVNWMSFIVSEDRDRVSKDFDLAVLHKSDFKSTYHTYTGKGDIIKVHTIAKFTGDGYFGILEIIK